MAEFIVLVHLYSHLYSQELYSEEKGLEIMASFVPAFEVDAIDTVAAGDAYKHKT